MKLPSFKRLFKNDFEAELQGFVEKLMDSINPGLENVYIALNKRLTRKDNMIFTEKDIEVTVNASGIPIAETQFLLEFEGKASGAQVERADNLTNPTVYPTSGVFVTWTQNANVITLNHVTGLPASNRFRLRVVVYG